MTPLQVYERRLASGDINPDSQQRHVIECMTRIFNALNQPSRWSWLTGKKPIRGMYLWGSVGIGKTFMMDLFCHCAIFPVERLHFFDFMKRIHQDLTRLQGKKNPLDLIAKEIASKTKVICFDEFFVSDITDAMLLGTLFQALFKAGIVLIATSNIPPDELYKNGLQRERFLPAIDAIKQHTDVIHLTTTYDYRYRQQNAIEAYISPLNAKTQHQIRDIFHQLSHQHTSDRTALTINHRNLAIHARSQGVLWCNFEALCIEDRSQDDYLELAQQFHTILLDNVGAMSSTDRKTILRFIHLIDILYDNHVRLITRAAVLAEQLYVDGPYAFEFRRTVSRLHEMQSAAYFKHDESI